MSNFNLPVTEPVWLSRAKTKDEFYTGAWYSLDEDGNRLPDTHAPYIDEKKLLRARPYTSSNGRGKMVERVEIAGVVFDIPYFGLHIDAAHELWLKTKYCCTEYKYHDLPGIWALDVDLHRTSEMLAYCDQQGFDQTEQGRLRDLVTFAFWQDTRDRNRLENARLLGMATLRRWISKWRDPNNRLLERCAVCPSSSC